MSSDLGKVLVIDASIARAAGQAEASYPTSKNCRDLLSAVLDSLHKIVMTPEMQQEYSNHQGRFAVRWLVAMDRKAKIETIASPKDEDLRAKMTNLIGQQIGKNKVTQEACVIMLKDCHLLEASLAADKIIVSLDDKVRFHFTVAAESIGEIREVVWVNPDEEGEEVTAWLEAGAEPEPHRQLGFQQAAQ